MKLFRRTTVAIAGCALVWSAAGDAMANSRFPAANNLVFNPSNPNHMLMRSTYGVLQTLDGGATWQLICEKIFMPQPSYVYDPPLGIFSDGSTFIVGQFTSIQASHDLGCNWQSTSAAGAVDIFQDQLVVDATPDPANPQGNLVLATHYTGSGYHTFLAATSDGARTWNYVGGTSALNNPLDGSAFPLTHEVAPSNSNRIYVSMSDVNSHVLSIHRTSDRGISWQSFPINLPADWADNSPNAGAFIAAIDPNNADRVYVRIMKDSSQGALNTSPSTILLTEDGGATWTEILPPEQRTAGPMRGFALSPDGTKVAFGSIGTPNPDTGSPLRNGGIRIGAAPRGPFVQVSNMQNNCLKWTAGGIWACALEGVTAEYEPFSLALSTDEGHTFVPKYKRTNTCQMSCPAGSTLTNTCAGTEWTNVQSLICPNGCQCGPYNGTGGTGSGGTAGAGGTGGTPSCGNGTPGTCSIGNASLGAPVAAGIMLALAGLFGFRRRGR